MRSKLAFVVDDDSLVRHLVATILGRHGFATQDFETGEAALAALEKVRPDLVVSDLYLPGTDGLHVLVAAGLRNESVGRILLTGDVSEASTQKTFDYRAAEVIVEKPFSFDGLGRALDALEHGEKEVVIRAG